jgi:ParB family chromosome partitioning protein
MSGQFEIGLVLNMPIGSLVSYPSNPFGLYTGQRLDDLVESVEANGVLVPVIARPAAEDGKYEILSGHNRVEACKMLGFETVPAIVREGLDDDEALLVVIETNLIQRSFSDFSPSERAATVTLHYDAIKQRGRRADLIKEVESLLENYMVIRPSADSPVANKLNSMQRIGREHGLSKDTVWRYLRLNKLILPHKNRLDSGAMSIRAAVELSFLSEEEQEFVDEVLVAGRYRLSMEEAEILRELPKPLTPDAIRQVVQDQKRKARSATPVTLKPVFLSRFFKPEQTRDEIEAIIARALERYFNG